MFKERDSATIYELRMKRNFVQTILNRIEFLAKLPVREHKNLDNSIRLKCEIALSLRLE